jgi:hypothetical protein
VEVMDGSFDEPEMDGGSAGRAARAMRWGRCAGVASCNERHMVGNGSVTAPKCCA